MYMLASFDCNDILNVPWGKCRKGIQTLIHQTRIRPIGLKSLSSLEKMIQEEHKVMKYLV